MIQAIVTYIREEVHNPLSTMSNLAYVAFGMVAIPHNWLLGGLLVMLGIASGGFHWTRSRAWHKFDIVAIYYVFGGIFGYLWALELGMVIGLIVAWMAHMWAFDTKYRRPTIGAFGIMCLIPYFAQNGLNATLYVLFWFGLAFAVSSLAVYLNPEEDSKEYDVWHGSWHIFSAIGIYLLII